jgi:LysM repeat protein
MPFRSQKFELSQRLKLGVGRGYSQNQILKLSAIVCLILALILTVNAVRLVSKGKQQASTDPASPQVLGESDTRNASDIESMQFTNYIVVKGDTLFNIAQKFNISWTTLATLNNIKSSSFLKPGQTLKVPKQ